MKQFKLIVSLLLSIVLVIGCADPKILERVGIVTLIGYDAGEEDKVTVTSVVRQVNPDYQSTVNTHTETEATGEKTRLKVNLESSKKIVAGQMRVVLFGEDIAKEGLDEMLHALIMNSEISTSIYVAVVEDSAQTLIEGQYKNVTDIGQHIYGIIEHNIEQQNAVSSTLHEVVRDFYSPLRDPLIPIVKKNGENIEISGTALFHKGAMVGEFPIEDTLYLMMVRGKFRHGTLELELPSEGLSAKDDLETIPISIDSIKSYRQMKLVDPAVPEFDLKVIVQCRLLEIHSSISTADRTIVEKLEKGINKILESEISRIVNKSIELHSDHFGFGEKYRADTRNAKLTEEEWHEIYKNLKVNVKVQSTIVRDGVFE
ncbi:Ger(x)C family spore germination protein [Lysinibacillus telephonicus]|uniref:Ger(X)C family spore germination protein n=1 Tax=Lysinibacillus telephonicus TaxID=1714840 RepID=A0A3S0J1P7_9BACI|nr:Ger(x)C family spore germination protein [Lysinibacillus telephonicus]RTQ91904.1 Ger(x)C family spore germination protein [Lysinibacillus telephonicus]